MSQPPQQTHTHTPLRCLTLPWQLLSGILTLQVFPEHSVRLMCRSSSQSYTSVGGFWHRSIFTLGSRDRTLRRKHNCETFGAFRFNWRNSPNADSLWRFTLGRGFRRRGFSLTRVEQDDGFEADKLLGLQFEHAKPRRGGEQHVEDFRHTLDAVAFAPATQSLRYKQNTEMEDIKTQKSPRRWENWNQSWRRTWRIRSREISGKVGELTTESLRRAICQHGWKVRWRWVISSSFSVR